MLLLEITVDTFISLSHCCFAQLLKANMQLFQKVSSGLCVELGNQDSEQNVL